MERWVQVAVPPARSDMKREITTREVVMEKGRGGLWPIQIDVARVSPECSVDTNICTVCTKCKITENRVSVHGSVAEPAKDEAEKMDWRNDAPGNWRA